MNSAFPDIQFNWSVWDNNPTVSWICNGNTVSVSLGKPPLSVANLPTQSLVAIVGNYDDFGSENLLLYSYDGALQRKFAAPQLGSNARFGRVSETPDGISAVVGFYDETGWVEKAGALNLGDGTIGQLHRSY